MILKQRALLIAVVAALLVSGRYCLGGPGTTSATENPRPTAAEAAPVRPLPVITVEAVYAGASAQVVAETVAAPIEQQVNGVLGMRSLRSQSTSDGRYTLHVTFEPNSDMNLTQVLVQNRVALAIPVLPDAVRQHGVTVKKQSGPLLAFLVLSSPNGKRDTVYLSNYATIQLKDELARLPGVGDVTMLGQSDAGLCIRLDPAKLVAHKLTVADVIRAVEAQKLQVVPGQGEQPAPKGQESRIKLDGQELRIKPGQTVDVEKLEQIIVKVDTEGRTVYLKDVARVELGGDAPRDYVLFNGKPVVLLGIYLLPQARPHESSAALQTKLAALRAKLPESIHLDLAFDFTRNLGGLGEALPPAYLRLDLQLPASASMERTRKVTESCEKSLGSMAGIQNVLAVCGPPFAATTNEASILVQLTEANGPQAKRDEVMRDFRSRLRKEFPDVVLRLCDLTRASRFPLGGYALGLAITDRGDSGDGLRKLAERLAQRLRKSEKLTDVWLSPALRKEEQLFADIDRAAATRAGVAMTDIMHTLQAFFGSLPASDFGRLGRTLQIRLQAEDADRKSEDIKKVKVRNAKGEMVALATLVQLRKVDGPVFVERLNMYPMVEITLNPGAGVSLTEAREFCEAQLEEVRKELRLPNVFSPEWLSDVATRK